ncbi:MAG: tRNA preQ1(34) S-adenosylmethionine ribosyltransferase-isomerase QueA [Candidatus Marinimicrobia bacterium]|nr:tRNA preQ1(34) S-adenosylmethionine ribosyltransferase-isomerase QueA [Candidatus Neomarinimicrobiota bacterium]
MRLSDFDYELPEELIAQYPVKERGGSRLMVLDRAEHTIDHKNFSDILDYFRKGDLLVVNSTMVYPARLQAVKDRTDAKVELFLLRELSENLWEVMVKPARKVRIGNKLNITDDLQCDVIDNTVSGGRVVRFKDATKEQIYQAIDEMGVTPLPPYINREPTEEDKEKYQTIFAERRGAVAAPTAGMHFSKDILEKLKEKGIQIASIVLHISLGTFSPVTVEDLSRHRMHSEYYEVSPEVAIKINDTKRRGKRVIAVGTSVVRTLETVSVSGFQITPRKGWTDKFIFPPYEFKMVDVMITNFHQPQSTLLMLVSAFADPELIKRAYKEAVDNQYRFFSYGDAMLIK